jgi:hypothetical protein
MHAPLYANYIRSMIRVHACGYTLARSNFVCLHMIELFLSSYEHMERVGWVAGRTDLRLDGRTSCLIRQHTIMRCGASALCRDCEIAIKLVVQFFYLKYVDHNVKQVHVSIHCNHVSRVGKFEDHADSTSRCFSQLHLWFFFNETKAYKAPSIH